MNPLTYVILVLLGYLSYLIARGQEPQKKSPPPLDTFMQQLTNAIARRETIILTTNWVDVTGKETPPPDVARFPRHEKGTVIQLRIIQLEPGKDESTAVKESTIIDTHWRGYYVTNQQVRVSSDGAVTPASTNKAEVKAEDKR